MITKTRESNRQDQAPCASCRHPYRVLHVYHFAPNQSMTVKVITLKLCAKCDEKLKAATAQEPAR